LAHKIHWLIAVCNYFWILWRDRYKGA